MKSNSCAEQDWDTIHNSVHDFIGYWGRLQNGYSLSFTARYAAQIMAYIFTSTIEFGTVMPKIAQGAAFMPHLRQALSPLSHSLNP
jgi:hypothetical protein